MNNELELSIYVFILAIALGLELVHRVSPLLHTPLMSLSNAISAISVVGALVIAGSGSAPGLSRVLGCIAVTASTINVVAGFLITDRMLKMFHKGPAKGSQTGASK
jgi:NAD(P) transhydrogenase subunit alpha